MAQEFSCEFCEIFKNNFFTEHLRATASMTLKYFSCSFNFLPIYSLIFTFIFVMIYWFKKYLNLIISPAKLGFCNPSTLSDIFFKNVCFYLLLLSSTCLTLNILKIIYTANAKNICSHCTVWDYEMTWKATQYNVNMAL